MSEAITIEILHRVPISRNDELVWLHPHDRPTLPASIAQHLIDQGYATHLARDKVEDDYGCSKAAGFYEET